MNKKTNIFIKITVIILALTLGVSFFLPNSKSLIQSFNGTVSQWEYPSEQTFNSYQLFSQNIENNELEYPFQQIFYRDNSCFPENQSFDGADFECASKYGIQADCEYLSEQTFNSYQLFSQGLGNNGLEYSSEQIFKGVNPQLPQAKNANAAKRTQELPWDCELTLSCGGLTYNYKLSDNIKGLSAKSKASRALYCSPKLKKQRIEQLVREGYSYYQAVYYVLPNIHKIIADISNKLNKPALDATVTFSKSGSFTYTAEKTGRYLEYEGACAIIYREMARQKNIELPLITLQPRVTQQFLKDHTLLRGIFSTDFSASGSNRAANIKLALSSLNGLAVAPEERISFNNTVGARTRERGYKEAKIIIEGEYVSGVGGGVCQVSTTLYNALLLSDIQVLRRAPHSLLSSYVSPSFDAMVNSSSGDLVFYNNTGHTLYLSAYAEKERAVIKFYGAPNDYEIVRKSEIISQTPRPEKIFIDREGKYADKVIYDTDIYILSQGSDGMVSKGKLLYYKDNKLIKVKELARDTYKATPRIIVKGALPFPALTQEKENKKALPPSEKSGKNVKP